MRVVGKGTIIHTAVRNSNEVKMHILKRSVWEPQGGGRWGLREQGPGKSPWDGWAGGAWSSAGGHGGDEEAASREMRRCSR